MDGRSEIKNDDYDDNDGDGNDDNDSNLGHKRVALNRKTIEAEQRRSKVLKSHDVNEKNNSKIERISANGNISSSSSSANVPSNTSINPKNEIYSELNENNPLLHLKSPHEDNNPLFPIIKRSLHTLSLEDDDINDIVADGVISHYIKNGDVNDNSNDYDNGNGNNHNNDGNESITKQVISKRHKMKMNKYKEDNESCNDDIDAPRRQKMRVLSSSSSPSSSSTTLLPSKEPSTGLPSKESSAGPSKEPSTGLPSKEPSRGLSSGESHTDKLYSKAASSSSSSLPSTEERFPRISNAHPSSTSNPRGNPSNPSTNAIPSSNANPTTNAYSTQYSDLIAQANAATARLQQLFGSHHSSSGNNISTRTDAPITRIAVPDDDEDTGTLDLDNYDDQSENSDDSDFGFGGDIGDEWYRNSDGGRSNRHLSDGKLYGDSDSRSKRHLSKGDVTGKSVRSQSNTKSNLLNAKSASSGTSTNVNNSANIPVSTGIDSRPSAGSFSTSSSASASIQRRPSVRTHTGPDIAILEGMYILMHMELCMLHVCV
jgi:myosin heavy subunit